MKEIELCVCGEIVTCVDKIDCIDVYSGGTDAYKDAYSYIGEVSGYCIPDDEDSEYKLIIDAIEREIKTLMFYR